MLIMKCMLKKSKKVPITFLERSLYNALSTSRQFFANKYTTSADTWNMSRLNAESVTKTVWQQIPGRLDAHATAKHRRRYRGTINFLLTGRPQMLTTSNDGGWCAANDTTGTVRRSGSDSMKTVIYQHGELESYSVCNVEPVELVT